MSTDPNPNPDPDPSPDDAPPEPEEGSGRYAVYDNQLTQYVSGVHDSKAKATEEAKELRQSRRHKGHKLTVRQV